MEAIVITGKKQNMKLISELAKKLGESVLKLSKDQVEDFALGSLMEKEKTGKRVSRKTIMKKLRS